MSRTVKVAIVAALLVGVGVVVAVRNSRRGPDRTRARPGGGPSLLAFGAGKCDMCKRMAPIIEGLGAELAGRLEVLSINVNDNRATAEQYEISIIPAQVFLDATGAVIHRHEGFYSREDILAKWKELGYELAGPVRQVEAERPIVERLLSGLTRAVEGTPAIALGAAFVWGVLSLVLSPCHLASIPLIVGFIDQQGRSTTRRALAVSTLFAAGILITIALIGWITHAAGRLAGDLGAWGNCLVAGIFFVVGLHLMDVIPMPWSGPGKVGMKRKGLAAALILGLVFGIALGPCTFAYMAPVLAVAFRMAGGYGAVLLAAYGLGHCSVIVLAGTSTELVQRYLNWNAKSAGAVILKRICGVLILLAGLHLIYIAP